MPVLKVRGTALAPGVSLNGRLYTKEMIAKAVTRAQERLAEDLHPLNMLTHHEAADDSTRIVGSLVEVTYDEPTGRALYRAEVEDTDAGATIQQLVKNKRLKNVSIRGYFLGDVRQVPTENDGMAWTADDLEIDGLDFTKSPGVLQATVAVDDGAGAGAGATETSNPRRQRIYESITADVDTTEEPTMPVYADNGYLIDRAKRLPLDTRESTVAAWRHLGEAEASAQYTPKQLKRVRQRVRAALTRHGVDVANETTGAPLTEQTTRLGDVAEWFDADVAGFCISAMNGPIQVEIRTTWPGLDPADLAGVAQNAMVAAIAALRALDLDGDLDAPPVEGFTAGGIVELSPTSRADPAGTASTTEEAVVSDAQPTQPAVETAAPTTPVPEAVAPAPTAAPAQGLTKDDLTEAFSTMTQAIVAALRPAEVAAAVEAPAPVVAETEDERIARLVKAGVAEALPVAIQAAAEKNPPTRKGLVAPVGEGSEPKAAGLPEGWPAKALHEYTAEERQRFMQPLLVEAVLKQKTA